VRLLSDLPAAVAVVGTAGLVLLFALILSALAWRRNAGALTWAGLTAIGFSSSLLVLTVVRDVTLLGAAALTAIGLVPAPSAALLRASALAVAGLAFGATLLGLYNARRTPTVRRVNVPIAGLPPALDGFSIAQLSDLHVGPTIRGDFVARVVERVNGLGADLIAVTGDVVDGRVAELAGHTAPLGRLGARHGVYAVTGNHEYYSGAREWIAEFERLGMRVLQNRHVVVEHDGARLVVAGVTDASAGTFDPSERSDPARALRGAPADAGAKVLLAHQPRSAEAAAQAGFHLQLSGHTHGGQFWPWNLFVPLQQPYTAGLARHGSLWVYTSRGTGYWGPPKRIGAPSEIGLLRLVAAK